MNNILNNTKGDRWIWLIVILLSVISMLAVYSSTGTLAYKQGKSPECESILFKHMIMLFAGIALMYMYRTGLITVIMPVSSKVLMVITIPLLSYHSVFGNHINTGPAAGLSIPGTGFSFPDIRFCQVGFNYLPGKDVIAQAGKY
jgi:cell division protein FtsW